MEDYSQYTQEQLINELRGKDNLLLAKDHLIAAKQGEINERVNQLEESNKALQTAKKKISNSDNTIAQLSNEVIALKNQVSTYGTVEGAFTQLKALTSEQKHELFYQFRTTTQGYDVFTALMFGA